MRVSGIKKLALRAGLAALAACSSGSTPTTTSHAHDASADASRDDSCERTGSCDDAGTEDGGGEAAALPDGECANVDDSFGDTTVNGGYRCTPTGGPTIGPSYDQCVNGQWIHAGDCTCLVTSIIDGQQYPTNCGQIVAAGAVQCLDADQSCLDCGPELGCMP